MAVVLGKPAASNLACALKTGATSRNLFPYLLGIRILREQVSKSREFGKVLNTAVFTEILLLLSLLSGQEKIHLYPQHRVWHIVGGLYPMM